MNTIQSRAGILLTVSLCLVFNSLLCGKTDELDKKATWQIPSTETVQESIQTWLEKQQLDSEIQQKVDEIWAGAENEASDGLLLRAVHTFSLFNEDAGRLFRVCRKRKVDTQLPVDDQKCLVRVRMAMPDEVALKLGELELEAVHLGDDLG